eukprot:scaffold13353_cov105-Isochrysis_galbana.AAC.1
MGGCTLSRCRSALTRLLPILSSPVIGRLSRSTLSTSSRWDASRRGMFGPLEGPVVSSGVARAGRLSVLPTAGCMLSCSP